MHAAPGRSPRLSSDFRVREPKRLCIMAGLQARDPMQNNPSGRKAQLPLSLDRQIAVLEVYAGSSGVAHLFHGRLHNLPALLGEMMIAGETDPGLFGLAIPFTMGAGSVRDEEQIRAIRGRAEELWQEWREHMRTRPDAAARGREQYLRAIDARLLYNPRVAVKVLRREPPDNLDRQAMIQRFAGEDRALRKLNHRNILRRYASIVDPRLGPCILLEHVAGKSLERIWRRRMEGGQGPLPLSAAAHIAYQLARALYHAHLEGVVHGDVRPANVWIEDAPQEEPGATRTRGLIKLAGFGVPRPSGVEALPYAAPEQARGGAAGPATDIYQMGVTLYVLVTGRLPLEGSGPEQVVEFLLGADPHPNLVHHVRAEVSPKFEALIEGAREKDPRKRWTMERVLEAVTQVYASRSFTLQDGPRASIAEELLERVQTNAAIKDYFRAMEALDLVRDFLEGVPPDKEEGVRRRAEDLARQYGPHRDAVTALRRIQKEHIAPVDEIMQELYRRYGRGEPLLTDDEKGVHRDTGDDLVVEQRSLIDYVLFHTGAAIRELSGVDPELVGEMHRRMVDRASSQEEACSDLARREISFGDDFTRKSDSGPEVGFVEE